MLKKLNARVKMLHVNSGGAQIIRLKRDKTIMSQHILIVENEIDIREILQEFFEGEGFEVSTAQHGLDAIHHLSTQKHPDVILLDLMMPVMSGSEFMMKRESNPEWGKIPVVIMSASNENKKDTSQFGLHWKIQKPLQLDDLFSVVTEAFQTHLQQEVSANARR